MHKTIVLILFACILLAILIPEAMRKGRGLEVIGKPSINKWLFIKAKLLMVLSWSFMVVQAMGIDLHSVFIPEYVLWIATFILFVGAVFLILALYHLGESTRMGLPTDTTVLKTEGMYNVSRNPLYVGAYTIGIASCIYCPNVINLLATAGFMYLHHRIVLGEEAFLQKQFGDAWSVYARKVRRYL